MLSAECLPPKLSQAPRLRRRPQETAKDREAVAKLDKLYLPNAAPRNSKPAVDSFTAQSGSYIVSLAHKVILSTAGIILAKYLYLI